ncbi:MAG: hypothetical protein Ct9H300mP8_11490 [Gammaproteobacteria bacterium]|nr:MAG: hypothetical protein Ct9H300mP8_11490 [Gammaproteobacteria bacterium]
MSRPLTKVPGSLSRVNIADKNFGSVLEFFTTLWNERVNEEPKSDLISMLAHGESTRDMDPMEYLGNLILLIVGGNDTTRNSISGGVLALNQFPDEFRSFGVTLHLFRIWFPRLSAGRLRSPT